MLVANVSLYPGLGYGFGCTWERTKRERQRAHRGGAALQRRGRRNGCIYLIRASVRRSLHTGTALIEHGIGGTEGELKRTTRMCNRDWLRRLESRAGHNRRKA